MKVVTRDKLIITKKIIEAVQLILILGAHGLFTCKIKRVNIIRAPRFMCRALRW